MAQGIKSSELPKIAAADVAENDLLGLTDISEGASGSKVITVENLRIVAHKGKHLFRQSTKPTTRPDGTALQSGDRWWDTSDQLWFFWNGAYWLTEQIFHATSLCYASITQGWVHLAMHPGYNLFLIDFTVGGIFNAPQDASNYWSFTLDTCSTAPNNSFPAIAAISTNTFAVAGGYQHFTRSTVLNAFLDASSLGALRVASYRIGSGGYTESTARSRYRLAKP